MWRNFYEAFSGPWFVIHFIFLQMDSDCPKCHRLNSNGTDHPCYDQERNRHMPYRCILAGCPVPSSTIDGSLADHFRASHQLTTALADCIVTNYYFENWKKGEYKDVTGIQGVGVKDGYKPFIPFATALPTLPLPAPAQPLPPPRPKEALQPSYAGLSPVFTRFTQIILALPLVDISDMNISDEEKTKALTCANQFLWLLYHKKGGFNHELDRDLVDLSMIEKIQKESIVPTQTALKFSEAIYHPDTMESAHAIILLFDMFMKGPPPQRLDTQLYAKHILRRWVVDLLKKRDLGQGPQMATMLSLLERQQRQKSPSFRGGFIHATVEEFILLFRPSSIVSARAMEFRASKTGVFQEEKPTYTMALNLWHEYVAGMGLNLERAERCLYEQLCYMRPRGAQNKKSVAYTPPSPPPPSPSLPPPPPAKKSHAPVLEPDAHDARVATATEYFRKAYAIFPDVDPHYVPYKVNWADYLPGYDAETWGFE
jgi:hypothetical protein